MADPFSSDVFYQSARDFAVSALEAQNAGNYRRVPLDSGTALEHLAKASLARRSPHSHSAAAFAVCGLTPKLR
jgi:hypothetical protein